MKNFTVDLTKEYPVKGGSLDCILMDLPFDGETGWKRPAVIVVPGGGYGMVSKREGEPIASAFWARGFQTFVLTYLCQPDGVRYPEQLCELAAAVDYVKKHADVFHVNKDEIFVVGFSAGGHLTGNLAVDYASVSVRIGATLDCKPTAVGLCYPVISHKYGHLGSHANMLYGYSETEKAALYKEVDLDEKVNENTAPAFIWATATDMVVPVENSLSFASAMAKYKVPFELHIYPEGIHGLSTADYEVNPVNQHEKRISRWVDDCSAFFRKFVKESY